VPIKRYTIHGRVQGVGFRLTTVRIASRFQVEGTVRNLRDGAVEIRVAGEADEVESFLQTVRLEGPGRIERVEAEELPEPEDFGGKFRVVS